jgi:hypothetical protein
MHACASAEEQKLIVLHNPNANLDSILTSAL